MNTVIFGATGYLGSHVAEQLALSGQPGLCLVRAGADTAFLRSLGLPVAVVDFSSDAAIAAVIRPGDRVCNCIADTRMHASDAQRQVVEIDLTSRLYRAAQQAGAAVFVQLSTVQVYGFTRHTSVLDESSPTEGRYPYNRAAIAREQALLALYKPGGTRLVILRPSNTMGARDTSFLPNFLKSYRQGMFPVVNGGLAGYSCMDARDVGRAMLHAAGLPGEGIDLYVAKGYDMTWLALKAAMDKTTGRRTRLLDMPRALMMGVAWLCERLYPWGSNPPLVPFSVEVLCTTSILDDSKLRATGFRPLYGPEETLTACLPVGT